jgi:hypothetical protein
MNASFKTTSRDTVTIQTETGATRCRASHGLSRDMAANVEGNFRELCSDSVRALLGGIPIGAVRPDKRVDLGVDPNSVK